MRVLVCGGRLFGETDVERGAGAAAVAKAKALATAQRELVFKTLDDIHGGPRGPISFLVEGGARGADYMALSWRTAARVAGKSFKADWKNDKKAAGPKRNTLMLSKAQPALIVAFPGGAGTADCVGKARILGIEVMEVAFVKA